MSYSVICPNCNVENSGSALQCRNCQTSLVGVPRIKDPISQSAPLVQPTPAKQPNAVPEALKTESMGHALWRSLRGSLTIFFLAAVSTAIICFLGNWRTASDFGTGLIYAGVVLVFVAWLIFRGSEGFVRGQANPLEPMNRAMPGTLSERTRQYWHDYMEGMNATAVIGFSVALCFGIGWLLISLAH